MYHGTTDRRCEERTTVQKSQARRRLLEGYSYFVSHYALRFDHRRYSPAYLRAQLPQIGHLFHPCCEPAQVMRPNALSSGEAGASIRQLKVSTSRQPEIRRPYLRIQPNNLHPLRITKCFDLAQGLIGCGEVRATQFDKVDVLEDTIVLCFDGKRQTRSSVSDLFNGHFDLIKLQAKSWKMPIEQ